MLKNKSFLFNYFKVEVRNGKKLYIFKMWKKEKSFQHYKTNHHSITEKNSNYIQRNRPGISNEMKIKTTRITIGDTVQNKV